MGTIIDITQYKLDRALANEEVDAKIKLRRVSHANLMEHVKNIPFKAVAGPKIKSSKFHLPEEQMGMNVSPKKYIQLVTGNYKPINVKEDKTENIRRHSDILVSMAIEKEGNEMEQSDEVSVTVAEEVAVEMPAVEETPIVKQEEVQKEMPVITNDTNIVENDNIVNISDYISKIENETQLVKDVKEKATVAQQEAKASDESVNEVSIEFNELEKQEADVVKFDSELDRQVIAAYENQTKTLALARKEYEDLIEESNARKQANENKIVQMQSKMNDIREHITTVNESIARKEAILAAIQQTEYGNNIIQFSDMNNTEEKVKRIA